MKEKKVTMGDLFMEDKKSSSLLFLQSLDLLLLVLGILFCILKASGVIDWAWVCVCIPFIFIAIDVGLDILIVAIVILVCYIYDKVHSHKDKKRD